MNKIYKDLSDAVTHGQLENVKDLINRYGVYNSEAFEYYSLLRKSIKLKHTEITQLLLTSGSEENIKMGEPILSKTPLHFAVRDEELEIIEMLLDHGANIHSRNECGVCPLLSAICMGKGNIFDLLIKKGTSPRTYNNGNSPLHDSTEQILTNLNNTSKQLSTMRIKTGESPVPIHVLYANENEKIVELPLDNNTKNNNMITLLYLAIRNCHPTITTYKNFKFNCANCKRFSMMFEVILNQCPENANKTASASEKENFKSNVEKLFNYNIIDESSLEYIKITLIETIQNLIGNHRPDLTCDKEQQMILHFTTERKRFEVVKFLFILKPIANSNATRGQTETPVIFFSAENTDTNFIKLFFLLKKRLPYWPWYKTGPYRITCTNNIIDVFYDYEEEIDCPARDLTQLHVASDQGNLEIIEILLKSGTKVNSKRETDDSTVLHTAARICHIDVMKLLLENGADVCSKNKIGNTPLHDAIVAPKGNYLQTVSILLQNGSPIDSKNNRGETPLGVAINYYSRLELVKLLLEFGSNIANCSITYPRKPNIGYARQHGCVIGGETMSNYFELKAREEKKIIFDFLLLHLIMLKTANLFVTEEHQLLIHSYGGKDEYILHKETCEDEVKALKLEKISDNNLNLHDILIKSTSSLVRCARIKDIKQIFESNNYKNEFPKYAHILERNINMGLLYERALEFFYCCFKLPYDCSNQIFQYLSHADIMRFMLGTDFYKPRIDI